MLMLLIRFVNLFTFFQSIPCYRGFQVEQNPFFKVFKVYYNPLRDDIHTNNKEGNTLTDSHIQEQQMHIYRVL